MVSRIFMARFYHRCGYRLPRAVYPQQTVSALCLVDYRKPSMSHILSGLRVIDCGTYIAGPAAAVIMSDFGAEVIKIERPPAGDPYRMLHLLPGMPVAELDYCWVLDGRNKKSLALDLGDAEGREAL